MTVTVTNPTQASTNFVDRVLVVLGDKDLRAVALFSALGLLATIYFAIHLPAEVSLLAQFP